LPHGKGDRQEGLWYPVSEYQYYEFLALDKPLTAQQRAELRELSTRAEITATSFTNEYHWGSFKGDPLVMMERYFDAFLYLANWGTRHLMFRMPRAALDADLASQYCHTDAASLTVTDDHLIISLYADSDPDDDYWGNAGTLASMVQARSELVAGDHRLLYLAWLMGIQWEQVDDDEIEPPVPSGLRDLSGALQAIAGFLGIDQDLIAVAAEASPEIALDRDEGLADWITLLPPAEKDHLLTMVAGGEGAQVQSLLLQRFRGNGRPASSHPPATARTAAELWQAADEYTTSRLEALKQARRAEEARVAAAEAAAHDKRLDALAGRGEAAWQQVDELIATKSPRDYDQAVVLLRDLSALAHRDGDHDSFTRRFLELRARHARKPSLQERFDKAGLPR
jgi:hypothetical protein